MIILNFIFTDNHKKIKVQQLAEPVSAPCLWGQLISFPEPKRSRCLHAITFWPSYCPAYSPALRAHVLSLVAFSIAARTCLHHGCLSRHRLHRGFADFLRFVFAAFVLFPLMRLFFFFCIVVRELEAAALVPAHFQQALTPPSSCSCRGRCRVQKTHDHY